MESGRAMAYALVALTRVWLTLNIAGCSVVKGEHGRSLVAGAHSTSRSLAHSRVPRQHVEQRCRVQTIKLGLGDGVFMGPEFRAVQLGHFDVTSWRCPL